MTLQRRTPISKRRSKPRRQAARCTVLRCTRRPYRSGLTLCGTHLMQRVDAEARRWVFERDNYRCRDEREHVCQGALSWAHLIGRGYHGVRHLLDNGVVLCAGAHQFYSLRPIDWLAWCEHRLGAERWQGLRALALETASGRAKFDLVQTARNFGIIP